MNREIEERIRLLTEELAAANELVVHVASVTAAARTLPAFVHELRHVLTRLAMNLDTLLRMSRGKSTAPLRDEITRDFEALRAMHEGILRLATIGTSNNSLTSVEGSVQESLAVVKPLIQACGLSLKEERSCALRHNPLVPNAAFVTAMVNLLLNAVEAMENTPLGTRAIEVEVNQRGQFTTVEVRDHGPGIWPEHLSHIWEPGFSTKPHKAGLGLSIVKSIVQSLGGEIDVESCLETGTRFTISLPEGSEEKT